MTMAQPERVGSLIMISATILTPDEHKMFNDYFQPVPLDDAGTRFRTMWERIVERRGPGATMEMMARSFAMNLLGGEAYEWGHHAAFAWWKEEEHALQTLPHRITILNPNDDLTECTRRAAPMLRNGKIIELPEWGYNFMDVWPEESAQLVLSNL
ncbi:MAG TPA: hypothetical protein DDX09_00795 [Hyphomonas atlantica]|nr:hypothetical protein [Hyphomonas atlantica]